MSALVSPATFVRGVEKGLSAMLWAAWTIALVAVHPVAAQDVAYSGSIQYSLGDYIFADRTHTVVLLNRVDASSGRWTVGVSLPVVYQSSPWVSYSVVGAVPSGGPQQGTVERRGRGGRDGESGGDGSGGPGGTNASVPSIKSSHTSTGGPIALPDTATYDDVGVGDPSLRAEWELWEDDTGASIRVTGVVKAPLADVDRGFGTGAWDASLGLSLSKRVGTAWFVFGDVAYWWLGDMDDLVLQDPLAFSASLGRAWRGGTRGIVASVSGSTEIVDAADPPLQVGLGFNAGVGQGAGSIGVTATAGLTDAAPAFTVGIGWRVAL